MTIKKPFHPLYYSTLIAISAVFLAVGDVTADSIVQEAYLKASNTDEGDRFGSSLAMDGDTLVVSGGGAAYVFVRDGSGTWSQQAYLDGFGGWVVALEGDTLVVGASSEDSSARGVNGDQSDNSSENSGAAYVFYLSVSPKILAINQIDG
jgi:hypothetical protein